jgi:5-methylcytosine-specific restriction endonuclease McrBC GTP-binding regulatory subunit McrB
MRVTKPPKILVGGGNVKSRPTFFLSVKVLRQVFRGELVAGSRDFYSVKNGHSTGTPRSS